jgi:hypothetical protein
MFIKEIIQDIFFEALPATQRRGRNREDIETRMQLPDGNIWLGYHFQDRWEEREADFDKNEVIKMIKDAVNQYRNEWVQLKRTSFVINKPSGLGVSVQKIPTMEDDVWKYRLETIHSTLYVRNNQRTYTVEEPKTVE